MKRAKAPLWISSSTPIGYDQALLQMNDHVKDIQMGSGPEQVWLLEHPPLYTLGTSAKPEDVLDPLVPAFKSGRGGEVTYHGPGQRVAYVMLDLSQRTKDIRVYVHALEEWLILTLADLGVTALRREGRVGLWVPESPIKDNKIAAIGVRVSKWVTSHGIALNVHPDLSPFAGIVPCGIQGHGVTSLHHLGINASLLQVDALLKKNFSRVF